MLMEALEANWRLEVLYMQGVVQKLSSEQMQQLINLFKLGRIWSVNMGEIEINRADAIDLARVLKDTNVSYMYVSEHFLKGFEDEDYTYRGTRQPLVVQMRQQIEWNRIRSPGRDANLSRNVVLNFYNPGTYAAKIEPGAGTDLLEGEKIEPLGACVTKLWQNRAVTFWKRLTRALCVQLTSRNADCRS